MAGSTCIGPNVSSDDSSNETADRSARCDSTHGGRKPSSIITDVVGAVVRAGSVDGTVGSNVVAGGGIVDSVGALVEVVATVLPASFEAQATANVATNRAMAKRCVRPR
jgi:hypothetical protein